MSCEDSVLEKLLQVLRFALACNGGAVPTGELNETFVLRVLNTIEKFGENENTSSQQFSNTYLSTNGETNGSNLSDPNNLEDVSTGSGENTHTLHKLEIIRVIVLITVISIIMLTTCRMVFQLFVRFRPEKSNH